MKDLRFNTGKIGEQLAVDLLQKKGYRLLSRNIHSRWGEIDLVMTKNDTLVFVEVKTRIGLAKGAPYEAVDAKKVRRLIRPIQFYIQKNHFSKNKYSLDVVSIILDTDQRVSQIKHFVGIDIPKNMVY